MGCLRQTFCQKCIGGTIQHPCCQQVWMHEFLWVAPRAKQLNAPGACAGFQHCEMPTVLHCGCIATPVPPGCASCTSPNNILNKTHVLLQTHLHRVAGPGPWCACPASEPELKCSGLQTTCHSPREPHPEGLLTKWDAELSSLLFRGCREDLATCKSLKVQEVRGVLVSGLVGCFPFHYQHTGGFSKDGVFLSCPLTFQFSASTT